MNILISNDDGANSIGAQLLTRILEHEGYRVFLVLPKSDSSGDSSKVNFNTELRYEVRSKRFIVVEGTPIECILVGLDFWKNEKIEMDLVLAGINQGMNIGLSRRYSGTLAITYEALAQGYPAISISSHIPIYKLSDQYAHTVITTIIKKYFSMLKEDSLFGININFFSQNEPVFYCEESSVVTVRNRLLCAAQREDVYSIEINKEIKPFNIKDGTVIIGSIERNDFEYKKELLESLGVSS